MSYGLKTVIFCILLFLCFPLTPASGAIIDQILAVVNDHLITQSDLRFQTLFSLEFPLLDEKEKDPHLQFAIDQLLLLEDAEKFATDKPADQEINDKLTEIETLIGSREKLNLVLAKEGVSRSDLRELINRYLLSKKFIDQRINFFIFISDNEIESYYNDHQADWSGAPLESVRNQINTILYEQKRKAKLEEFLVKRRSKATITINPPYSTDSR